VIASPLNRRPQTIRTVFVALCALCAMGAAARETVDGAWSFSTAPFDGGCVMTGALVVLPSDAQGRHACRLTTMEICPAIRGGAEESCVLTEDKGEIVIKSVITKGPGAAYEPDDFALRLESASRMSGRLQSAGGTAPAIFVRGPAAVS
jgi:hypothetical protein